MRFSLRKASRGDADFMYRVIESTMRSYVERTWGTFSEAQNRKGVAKMIDAGTASIIVFEREDIGLVAVEQRLDHIWLAQLFIMPSHQNRGIGTSILRRIAQDARDVGKPVRLRILAVNPARRLYEREGFRVSTTTPERVYMELRP